MRGSRTGVLALRRHWVAVVVALLIVLAPMVTPSYSLRILNVGLIYAVMILGLNFVLGWTGLLSLAQAAFVGVGAYASALLTVDHGWSFWPAVVAGGLLSAIFAIVVGVPTLRLRSHYFAMATLALGEIVRLVLQNWEEVTHGADGVVGIPPPALGAFEIDTDARYFVFLALWVAVAAWAAARIRASSYGRSMLAIHQSEVAASAMGVDVARMKLTAFVLSAFYGGIAGALYAHLFQFISPDVFSLQLVVIGYVGLVLGGTRSVAGAVVGGVLVSFLPEWLRGLERYSLLIYGVGIVLLLVLMPQGIIGATRRLWDALPPRAKSRRELASKGSR